MATLTKERLGSVLASQGILIAFILFMIAFTIANPKFLSADNVLSVIRSSAIIGVIALGVTFVVISGNLDLSVGSMMSFSVFTGAFLAQQATSPNPTTPKVCLRLIMSFPSKKSVLYITALIFSNSSKLFTQIDKMRDNRRVIGFGSDDQIALPEHGQVDIDFA